MTVPAIPRIEDELLVDHDRAHRRLADMQASVSDHAVKLFTLQQRRIVIESIAYVRPVIIRREEQLLMVPPRAFLYGGQDRRMIGCTTLFRYIDSRSSMGEIGFIEQRIDRAYLAVVHALAESAMPSGHARETNPGMFRTVLTKWNDQLVNYTHPPAGDVEGLIDEAIDVANTAPEPACVRAAWLTFTLLSVHPFVDGNGRTARSMYMAVTAPSLPLGIDWGVLEQWSIWRREYIVSNQQGQAHAAYDPPKMDARPFLEYATRTSIAGANVCTDRMAFFERYIQHHVESGLSDEQAMLLGFIEMWRIATLDELTSCGLSDADTDAVISDLIAAGIIRWAPRPHSRRTFEHPDPFGLVIA